MRTNMLYIILLCFTSDFTVTFWNVESGDSSDEYVLEKIKGFDSDLIVLCECSPKLYAKLPGQKVCGLTGGNDRIACMGKILGYAELTEMSFRGRAPLVVWPTRLNYPICLVHLYSSKPDLRMTQTKMLAEWAKDYTKMVIVGDFNYFDKGADYKYLSQFLKPCVPFEKTHKGGVPDMMFYKGMEATCWAIMEPLTNGPQRPDHRPIGVKIVTK